MACVDSARTALAALRYKAKHGRLPEKLDALVPHFVQRVPRDPFDAKPLRYRKEKAGFVVYAVGTNGKDDGGRTEYDEKKREYFDIGFRVRLPNAQF